MAKLTLQETLTLALKSHLPLELVPGLTTSGNHRFHVLMVHEKLPTLSLVFGDEKHGYLFQNALVHTGIDRDEVRVSEADVRAFLETPAEVPYWSREMPAAPQPVYPAMNALVGAERKVRVNGYVTRHTAAGFLANTHNGQTFEVLTDDRPLLNSWVAAEGSYSYPFTVEDATLFY